MYQELDLHWQEICWLNIKSKKIYYIGQLFQYAGIIGSSKRVKGQKANYNVYLKKRLLGVLPGSFLKARSPYAVVYYQARIQYLNRWINSDEEGKKNLSLAHQHMMANRKMIQQFIKDYYVAFRTIMNIPVIKSYEEEKLGIVHVGNSWTTPTIFLDMTGSEKKEYKEKTIAKIVELKETLDNMIKESGIKKLDKSSTDENDDE